MHRSSAAAGIAAAVGTAARATRGSPLEALPGFAFGAATVLERCVTSRLGPRQEDMHPDRPTRLLATGPTPRRPRPVSAIDGRIPISTWISPPRKEVPQA